MIYLSKYSPIANIYFSGRGKQNLGVLPLSFHISTLWQELGLQNETAPLTKDGSSMCDT